MSSEPPAQALVPQLHGLCGVSVFSSYLSRILPAVTAYLCDALSSSQQMMSGLYNAFLMDALHNYSYLDFFFILKSSCHPYLEKQPQRK